MPLLPSLDPADIWGATTNAAIRGLTRAPLAHSAITALTAVETGTLVPCTTHNNILRWSGSAWEIWFGGEGLTKYFNNYECYFRVGTDVPVLSHVGDTSSGTEAAKWNRRWASVTPAGIDPVTTYPLYKFEFFAQVVLDAGMISDWSAEHTAQGRSNVDMILGSASAFGLSGHMEVPNQFYGATPHIPTFSDLRVTCRDSSVTLGTTGDLYYGQSHQYGGNDWLMSVDTSATQNKRVDYLTPFTWAAGDNIQIEGHALLLLTP